MKNFAHASFSPEKIQAMTSALQAAIDTLPEPVSSHLTHRLAETILRAARDGEFNALASKNGAARTPDWSGELDCPQKSLWRQVEHEVSNARDANLILAVIASLVGGHTNILGGTKSACAVVRA